MIGEIGDGIHKDSHSICLVIESLLCRECPLVRISVGRGYLHTYSELTLSGPSVCCLCHQCFNLIVSDRLKLSVDLSAFFFHVTWTTSCIFCISVHRVDFPSPLSFRVTFEWDYNILSIHFLLFFSTLCKPLVNQTMLSSPFVIDYGVLPLRHRCGARQTWWSRRLSHWLYKLLLPSDLFRLDLMYTFPFDNGILRCTSNFMIQQIISHSVHDLWLVSCNHLVPQNNLGLVFSLSNGLIGSQKLLYKWNTIISTILTLKPWDLCCNFPITSC